MRKANMPGTLPLDTREIRPINPDKTWNSSREGRLEGIPRVKLQEYQETPKLENVQNSNDDKFQQQLTHELLTRMKKPKKNEGSLFPTEKVQPVQKEVDPALKDKIADRIPDLKTPLQQEVMGRMKILAEDIEKQLILEKAASILEKAEVAVLTKNFLKAYEQKLILKELYPYDRQLYQMAEELNIRKGLNLPRTPMEQQSVHPFDTNMTDDPIHNAALQSGKGFRIRVFLLNGICLVQPQYTAQNKILNTNTLTLAR
jgi:hypothetical protein